jgi:nucleoside-diphosphate-sugar epimerase
MRIFVTGASGFLGGHVLRELVKAGHRVVALTRKSAPESSPDQQVSWVQGCIEDPGKWQDQLRECEACVHLVGILREVPEQGITFEKIHYKATVELLRVCGRMGVKRFLYMSANGVEKGLTMPYMRTKALAEQAVQSSTFDWTILRPSVIYAGDPGRPNFVSMLAEVVRAAPMLPILGDGRYRLAPISAHEVALSVAASLARPYRAPTEATGRIFHLCGSEVYTFKALLFMILDAQGSHANTLHVPFWLVSQVAALFGRFSWFPVTKDQLSMLRYGNDCPAGALTQSQLEVSPVSFREWLQSPQSLMVRKGRRELPKTGDPG